MKRIVRILVVIVLLLLLAACLLPFLIPIPTLDTVPRADLAYEESHFVDVNGIEVHYTITGEGQPAFVLLHGFLASTFSWREVVDPLAAYGTVVAYDRPGYGLTERPMSGEWAIDNPYATASQPDLLVGLMDELGIERAILVGNSAGGTVAALTALDYPERVEALVLVDPAIYTGGGRFPRWVVPLLRTPQARRVGPWLVRSVQQWGMEFGKSAWHDPSRLTPEVWEGYTRPLRAENWDRALWEILIAGGSIRLDERLDELRMHVLVVTGDDDRIVPTADSVRLAGELSDAELAVIPECGHVPHEECPAPFMEAVEAFLVGRDLDR
ncbi:MAG TPA: alpha/beta hydrolase [Anaerolineae bacterium]|nr:alpha/beta hydrolase [Anaerolineae bacterium]